RDVKPGNLLIIPGKSGVPPSVKILDMGLARTTNELDSEATDLTRTGQVLGTPEYMAPEQARSTKTADIRADVFSLGCVLFRLLTGKLPFQGGNAFEMLMARTTRDAPPARDLRPNLPAKLDRVISKMLQRKASKRYQTPAEVMEALAPFAMSTKDAWNEQSELDLPAMAESEDDLEAEADSGLQEFLGRLTHQDPDERETPSEETTAPSAVPHASGSESISSRSKTPKRKRKSPAPWIAAGICLAAVVLGGWMLAPWNEDSSPGDFSEDLPEWNPKEETVRRKPPKNPQPTPKRNDRKPKPDSKDVRREIRRFEPHDGPATAALFSPDGKLVLSAGADGKLLLSSVESGKPVA
ncbi:MAG: protein kinase, partial [Planctomycetales bacterium]